MSLKGVGSAEAVRLAHHRSRGCLPGLIGLEYVSVDHGAAVARLPLRDELLAPNGYLHAASVIALADTCCGFGAWASLPEGAEGFTTIELKSNFMGTARDGTLRCEASMLHGGRMTQVWDATVVDEGSHRTIAAFRCTQMILYPRRDQPDEGAGKGSPPS